VAGERRCRAACAGLALGAIVVAFVPAVARGALPGTGALYADGGDPLVYLRLSRHGRQLSPGRSVVSWSEGCGKPLRLHLGSRSQPVRVASTGVFEFVRRRGRFVFRLKGRFLAQGAAKVRLSYRRVPIRRKNQCDHRSARLVARPFTLRGFRDCRPYRAKNLLQTPAGRVFQLPWDGETWTPVDYACLFSTSRLISLGNDVKDDINYNDLRLFRLTEPFVAYVWQPTCEFCPVRIVVRDLRDGARKHDFFLSDSCFYCLSDLEVKNNASIAWIQLGGKNSNSIWAMDALGKRELDRGNTSRNLELTGSTLTWIKDGTSRSTTLY
jgi:hypothetical protein